MKNNQPHSGDDMGGTKANTTQTYSQTPRSVRNKTKCARRVSVGLILLLLLVLGGGVYILYRTGQLNRLRPHTDSSSSSESDAKGLPDIGNLGMSPTSAGFKQPTADGDLSGYIIILDPGHGGKDEGCGYPFNSSKYFEKDINLSIAQKVCTELQSRGAVVYMLREDDSWISLYSRLAQTHMICMDILEENNALPFSEKRAAELRTLLQQSVLINDDSVASGGMGIMVGSGVGEELEELMEMEYQLENVLFISIHLNSSESYTYHGAQVYFVTDTSVISSEKNQQKSNSEFQRDDFPIRDEYYGRKNEENRLLANCMYDCIVEDIPDLATNGDKIAADNYAVLREHGLVGVLVEVAFLSDTGDREFLLEDSNLEKVAVSIADGIVRYYEQLPSISAEKSE